MIRRCPGRLLRALVLGALLLSALPGPAAAEAPATADAAAAAETDPAVLAKLEWFQDQKFGLLLHWGPYSQWQIVESWSLCPEDENWCERRGPHAQDYFAYKQAYEGLKRTFNPARFDPAAWAAAARRAGMRYVVFTTKHHDGFCMFDTRQTDYRVTAPDCPFSTHPKANIAGELFAAFRAEGLGIGAYFSKPDWHSPDYWWPYFPPSDRNVNYEIAKHPARWEAFKAFTHAQIKELMSDYGPIDILWLDGGWVQPMTATSPRWGKLPCNQDIDMPALARMARARQPGLIIVDRAVEGPYQNYRTPEQDVPATPPDYVWETCMTMATSWSYVATDTYKPARELIHLLVDIVAKGGNLLLNIGPSSDGELPPASLDRLAALGDWMQVNSSAIYGTRAAPPYRDGRLCYTRLPDGTTHAIYLAEGDEQAPPAQLVLRGFTPKAGSAVRMLGVEAPLAWQRGPAGAVVTIPESIREKPPCAHAWVLRFTPE